jgi:hypothetical protein
MLHILNGRAIPYLHILISLTCEDRKYKPYLDHILTEFEQNPDSG